MKIKDIFFVVSYILHVFANNCYQDYPLIIGDSTMNSYFQALDMDPNSNIIAGGAIEVTTSNYQPLVAYAKSVSSLFQWSFYI
jgi:hypothetical protein